MQYKGVSFSGFKALCQLRNEERVFSVEKILEIRIVKSEKSDDS